MIPPVRAFPRLGSVAFNTVFGNLAPQLHQRVEEKPLALLTLNLDLVAVFHVTAGIKPVRRTFPGAVKVENTSFLGILGHRGVVSMREGNRPQEETRGKRYY